MSDAPGQPGDPYGSPNPYSPPPPPPNPYDPASAPPAPSGPAQPFGPAGPDPAGPDPAGQPRNPYAPPPGGYPPPREPDGRPGTVTAASIVTVVTAGLSLLLFGLLTLGVLVARDDVVDELARSSEFQDAGISADSALWIFVAVLGGLTAWCLVACVLGLWALRRSNTARVLLVVSAGVAALLSLVSIGSVVSVVPLVASVAVIALLFVGGANDWYRRSGA